MKTISKTVKALVVSGIALSAGAFEGCSTTADPGDSETHFLARCTDDCGGGFECLCGACTANCVDDYDCSHLAPGARCREATGLSGASCGDELPGVCDVECDSDADCARVSPVHECAASHCRAPAVSPPDGGSGAPDVLGTGGAPGASDASTDDSLPAFCRLPPVTGTCEAYLPRFYYDPETGGCEPFIYGGCDGNENRFETADECLAACEGDPCRHGTSNEAADCCCVGAEVSWAWDGDFASPPDPGHLFDCDRHEMPGTCETILPPCGATGLITAVDIQAALADPIVSQAFSEAPVTFGRDLREVDGPALDIDVDGNVVTLGSPCGTAEDCVDAPPQLTALGELLDALNAQQRDGGTCAP